MAKVKNKKFSLTEEERSDYYFNYRLMKEYQMVAEFWAIKLKQTRNEALKRNSVDESKVVINWESVLEDGTFTSTPRVDSGKK